MTSPHDDQHPEDDVPGDPERQAAGFVWLVQQTLLETYPGAARLRFSATVDGKFLTVTDLLDSAGEVLAERVGDTLVLDDVAITGGGQLRDVRASVEYVLAHALLLYPYPITAMPGVMLDDVQKGLYSLEITDN